MEVILKFNEEEIHEAKLALKAGILDAMIMDIWQRCFRPMLHYGRYDSDDINEIIKAIGEEKAYELIEAIGIIYNNVILDRD